ncbi:diadenylate cyclase CdaA [Fluviispira multicolorata]|uniref:Diadenylate cyclase n=1 Tax=Fluviispira multicolorata TaxID=2654512 RepID=A0A833JDC1_9BACT|nr:diadenylate cyclase CdaA [Fluviispira multicolorata]KAB8031785.1 TIGR00159 family protein [Fluviispira multicolorata]
MNFLESIKTILSWRSIVDITIVATLFYNIISILKGTRAAQVLIGMLVIFIAFVISNSLQFETIHWIISKFYASFIIVVIVLFQDDIRRLLTRVGRGPFVTGLDVLSGTHIIEEVTNAAKSLSHERIGALIVFERSVGLDKLYDHSVKLDAIVSEQLLSSIFQSFSPLHDGAVIIQKTRINCASAQLPLSKNPRFSKKMGTRHSAAVGISEETDAVVLVVSEETGNISIAWEGNLQKQSSVEATRKMLSVLLIPRGQKSNLVYWIENKVIFKYYKLLNKIKLTILHSKNITTNPELDKRKPSEKSINPKKVSSLESLALQQIEQENKLASNSPKNIHIKFPQNSKIKQINYSEIQFITSNINASPTLNIKKDSPEENLLDESELNENDESNLQEEDSKTTNASKINSALKSLNDLAPEDRFDPPIPKSPPPRNVSIGGIPLDPPIEEKNENEKSAVHNKDEKK